jgi:hypothetical protein
MIIRHLVAFSAFAALLACTAPQPFEFGVEENLDVDIPPVVDPTPTNLDPTDPNISVDNKFAFDRTRGLTMNSIQYVQTVPGDPASSELIINNLPFDGPDGRYTYLAGLGDADAKVYESIQTATTGLIKHYAVFVQSDHIDGAAAAGQNWINFGYGGANIVRDSFSLPSGGEYEFVGNYAGVRTFSDRSGLELVSGTARILLDIEDFDPSNGTQGAIVGTISNRTRQAINASVIDPTRHNLTGLSLVLVEFNTADGTFDDGEVASLLPDGLTAGATGTYDGFLAGINSTNIGANVVVEGPAYSQMVQYEVVTYTVTRNTTTTQPDGTQTTNSTVTQGNAPGLTVNNEDIVQDLINDGDTVPYLDHNPADIPSDAQITGTRTDALLFTSEFNAREIGVVVTTR